MFVSIFIPNSDVAFVSYIIYFHCGAAWGNTTRFNINVLVKLITLKLIVPTTSSYSAAVGI